MMEKELSEMTLEELWDLFPIFLVPHDDRWDEYYREIKTKITDLLTGYPVKRISHIGSTAVQGIWAKNIVDVMVEISEKADMEEAARILEQNGFIRMSDEKGRISLNKGYTKEGFAEKVYHIHLRYTGDNDELYFRDYLNEHPQIAKEYEALKLALWKRYEHDRDAYTSAKTDFIRRWTAEARMIYGGRYLWTPVCPDIDESEITERNMLIKITDYKELDPGKLMDVYSESNYENTDYFFPDEPDQEIAVQKVKEGFLDFLKNDFFRLTDAAYWILEKDGVYVSALRTCMIQKGLYWLEALETRPDCRRMGYGTILLTGVADALRENGPFRLCCCVSKKNTASLKTHEKCGFRIVSEVGYDYLNEEADDHDFGLEYCYHEA